MIEFLTSPLDVPVWGLFVILVGVRLGSAATRTVLQYRREARELRRRQELEAGARPRGTDHG